MPKKKRHTVQIKSDQNYAEVAQKRRKRKEEETAARKWLDSVRSKPRRVWGQSGFSIGR